ncbi:type I methionyl aminopeptidase [Candidatus Berkelbacteria bacterium]|nr:type I methionyl aminopeptidase [Candidatus Berkelbacteria bacterium]
MPHSRIKSAKAIAATRQAGQILAEFLEKVTAQVKPGATGIALDQFAENFIRDHGAEPAFKGFLNFPHTLCVSINDGMVHGIPNRVEIKPGDVVKIDAGVKVRGWNTDAARTILVPPVNPISQVLVNVTQTALDAGISHVRDGTRLGTVQSAIQAVIEGAGLGLTKTLSGHGIGRSVHEPPTIPNYGKVETGELLQAGMVICLEPMVTLGNGQVVLDKSDGWTYRSVDHTITAHIEDTILVTRDGADVLSRRESV